jgi:glycerol-3-phosphate dehydrogenase (NAD(P)+)
LDGPKFAVFGSQELLGAELAGALKNVIALCTGMLNGIGMGKNLEALLITRGLRELIYIGKAMGVPTRHFWELPELATLLQQPPALQVEIIVLDKD